MQVLQRMQLHRQLSYFQRLGLHREWRIVVPRPTMGHLRNILEKTEKPNGKHTEAGCVKGGPFPAAINLQGKKGGGAG